MMSLEDKAGLFGAELRIFAVRNRLPEYLFRVPDHLVLQAAGAAALEKLFQDEIAPKSKKALCVETEPRFKVAAELSGRLSLHDMGFVDWVEIDEPKLEQPETTVQRVEYYTDSLEKTRTVLTTRDIHAPIVPEKSRAYIGVKSPGGVEVRFTDTALWEIAESRLEEEEAIPISLAKRKAA